MVVLCSQRILRMEEQVGLITDNPNYELDALEHRGKEGPIMTQFMPASKEGDRFAMGDSRLDKTHTFGTVQMINRDSDAISPSPDLMHHEGNENDSIISKEFEGHKL